MYQMQQRRRRLCYFMLVLLTMYTGGVEGLAVNWGDRASHPLPGDIVVRLLKDNGFNKVKLFEAEPQAMMALGRTGIEVMVGIPNELLYSFATSIQAAEDWVARNISLYVSKYGVDIRHVAVGNEPFLTTYKGKFEVTTFPALQNVQAAIIRAGLGRQVKVTIPLNADVYESDSGLPSGGNFRADIRDLMVSIVKFLVNNGAPLTINIYPFLSLYADPNFPLEYAFFSGDAAPVVDGPISYTNVFDANFDTLVWALEKNGFASAPVIVGEIGWPTDGNANAKTEYAQRFNQGLIDRIVKRQGTPKRPNQPPEVYMFGLVDEDMKSVEPGNFERHWGVFYFDGTIKYPLDLGNGRSLVSSRNVRYMDRRWCVMSPEASISDPNLADSINYACSYADCTSLGYGSSCGGLDIRSNASYAFNMFYQRQNQQSAACRFSNLATVTTEDPSQDNCRFEIMIDISEKKSPPRPREISSALNLVVPMWLLFLSMVYHVLWQRYLPLKLN